MPRIAGQGIDGDNDIFSVAGCMVSGSEGTTHHGLEKREGGWGTQWHHKTIIRYCASPGSAAGAEIFQSMRFLVSDSTADCVFLLPPHISADAPNHQLVQTSTCAAAPRLPVGADRHA